jgi:hypothetical protein
MDKFELVIESPPANAEMDWQPIDTAPHATDVLVWQDGAVVRARKTGNEWLSYIGSNASVSLNPSRWCLLPRE